MRQSWVTKYRLVALENHATMITARLGGNYPIGVIALSLAVADSQAETSRVARKKSSVMYVLNNIVV